MKKCLILLLCVCLVTALTVPPAGASEEASPLKLEYALRIEGDMEAGVTPGDTVTVVFSLQRSDGGSGSYALRILQNEILFDESFFEYVPDSATVLKSGNALYQTRTDGTHIIKASYLSSNGGSFGEQEDFCSFRLRVKAAEGTGWVRCDPECAKAYDGDNLRVTIQPAEELRLTASGACHPFEDVQKTDWYHEAVDYVWQHGLMNGMGNGTFLPEGPLRICEAVKLAAVIRSRALQDEAEFAPAQPWYRPYAEYAEAEGILQPGEFADRMGEAVTRGGRHPRLSARQPDHPGGDRRRGGAHGPAGGTASAGASASGRILSRPVGGRDPAGRRYRPHPGLSPLGGVLRLCGRRTGGGIRRSLALHGS